MKKNTLILIGVLAVLVLIAGVQLIQFSSLTKSLSNVKVSGTAPATSSIAPASSSSGSGSTPSALSSLPSQVGSC